MAGLGPFFAQGAFPHADNTPLAPTRLEPTSAQEGPPPRVLKPMPPGSGLLQGAGGCAAVPEDARPPYLCRGRLLASPLWAEAPCRLQRLGPPLPRARAERQVGTPCQRDHAPFARGGPSAWTDHRLDAPFGVATQRPMDALGDATVRYPRAPTPHLRRPCRSMRSARPGLKPVCPAPSSSWVGRPI